MEGYWEDDPIPYEYGGVTHYKEVQNLDYWCQIFDDMNFD